LEGTDLKNLEKKYYVFVGLGFEIVAFSLFVLYVGPKFDSHFQSQGIYTVLLLFLFLGIWIGHMIYLLRKL
jgi:hypothetical protein